MPRSDTAETARDRASWRLEILLAHPEAESREAVSDLLANLGHRVHPVSDGAEAIAAARARSLDVAIIDVDAPGLGGFALMRRLRALNPHVHGILAADSPCVEDAVSAIKARADYLTKPLGAKSLLGPISSVAQKRWMRAELHAKAATGGAGVEPILGQSPLVKMLRRNIEVIAQARGPVLVSGERGSGKELAARTLHASGPRAGESFATVDCAALAPEARAADLSERLRSARGGTLHLDEISALPPGAQAPLARLLELGHCEPAGAEEPDPARARLIASTRWDLREFVDAGSFRQDLFCLLGEFCLTVPPLRKRRDDLPLLVTHFLEKHGAPGSPLPQLAPETWAILSSRQFRGNVRELELAIKHAIVLSDGGDLQAEHLPAEFLEETEPDPADRCCAASDPGVIPLNPALTTFEHRKSLSAKLKRYRARPPLLTVAWSR